MSDWPSTVVTPSWVTSGADPTQGVDILGLRAVVQGVGGELLDGITTVTPTLRYLSLRTWIARRYALARLPNSDASFSEFAGRVEAAVAIGNILVTPATQGLVGSNGAQALLSGGGESVEVRKLAGQLAVGIYAGASDQLGLSMPSENAVPVISVDRGQPLFDAAERALGRTRFADRLAKEPTSKDFSRDDLREVGEKFAMASPDAEERSVLLEAVLPSHPRPLEVNRLASYALLLELAHRHGRVPRKAELFALALAPDPDLPDLYRPWLDGWARYLLRDMLAVVHEAALEALVGEVERIGTVDGASVVAQLLAREDELDDLLSKLGLSPEGGVRPLDLGLDALRERIRADAGTHKEGPVRRWGGQLTEETVIAMAASAGAGALALLPVAWLLVAERLGASNGQGLGERGMSRQGRERLGVDQVILPEVARFLEQRRSVREVAVELSWRTLEQHLSTAWSRLAVRPEIDVACVIADGSSWSFQRRFRGGRTAERVSRGIGWLQQLGLLASDGPTTDGQTILARIRGQLTAVGGDR